MSEQNKKELSPIFIIGLPRSGSTIVETIISSGKEKILNLGETNLINWSLVSTYKKIQMVGEVYISHVIYQMLLDGKQFYSNQVSNFIDWGTQDDWNKYIDETK